MKRGIYDILKINNEIWFAYGEYELSPKGYSNAKQLQKYIKSDLKKKARIVKRTTGYQVYSDDKNAVNFDFRK